MRYIKLIAQYEKVHNNLAANNEMFGMFAKTVLGPIGGCLSTIDKETGDGAFIDQELKKLSPAIRTLSESAAIEAKEIQKALHHSTVSIANRIKTISKLDGDCLSIKKYADERTAFEKTTASAIDSFNTGRDCLPYAAIAYASAMVALGQYSAAAITMHNWIHAPVACAENPAHKWYVLRARFALMTFIEEWIRARGTGASSLLRQYHIDNMQSIITGMKEFVVISTLSSHSKDYKFGVGLFGAWQSEDEGLCNFPDLPAAPAARERQPDSHEQTDLVNLFESYLGAISTFVDHGLKHPIAKTRQATKIGGYADELMSVSLKCINAESRVTTRAQHIERYVRNQLNLIETVGPLKSNDELQTQITNASSLSDLGC